MIGTTVETFTRSPPNRCGLAAESVRRAPSDREGREGIQRIGQPANRGAVAMTLRRGKSHKLNCAGSGHTMWR